MIAHDKKNVRLIAFYLPQFHPIPENDAWWGRGFTEWRNVVQAKPLFPGHYQPHIPADLGFYDLRVPETRQAQADLAREYGISGFCYYHYWFSGKRLLERPFNEVSDIRTTGFSLLLVLGERTLDARCVGWTIRSNPDGANILRRRPSCPYPLADVRSQDPRYIRVGGKAVFLVYHATSLPNPLKTTETWRAEAQKMGIGDLFLCSVESNFPGVVLRRRRSALMRRWSSNRML